MNQQDVCEYDIKYIYIYVHNQVFHFIRKVRELKWNEMYGLQVQMKWNEMKCFSFFNSVCEMKINEIILH